MAHLYNGRQHHFLKLSIASGFYMSHCVKWSQNQDEVIITLPLYENGES